MAKMAEKEDPEHTSSHGHTKITTGKLLMRKTGRLAEKIFKDIKKEPQ